jgi:hypothetical protein
MPNSLIPDVPITPAQVPRSTLSKSGIAAPFREWPRPSTDARPNATLRVLIWALSEFSENLGGRGAFRIGLNL